MSSLDWMDHAACRNTDPRIFFPDDERRIDAGRALHICRAHCPVQRECENRRRALNLQSGVIGGNHWVTIGSRPRISPATQPTAAACELGCPNRAKHTCPTCGTPLTGLMTGCDKPLCRSADIAEDHAHVRRDDR